MNRYQLWPFTKLDTGEYTIPDVMLEGVWRQMVEERKAERVFYEGMDSLADWMRYVKSPLNHFVFVADNHRKAFVFMAWLNPARNMAYSHFCGLGKNTYRPEIGRLVLNYWRSFGFLDVVVGIIPEVNRTAVKLAVNLGYRVLGTIPTLCRIAATGESTGGVILYYLMGGGGTDG